MSPSAGQHALVARFLGSARDRLTRLNERVISLTNHAGQAEAVTSIGRELHTLKGEARLLGLAEIERLTHAAEDMLYAHQRNNAISADTVQLLCEAIDAVFLAVQEREGDTVLATNDVEATVLRLRNAAGPVLAARSETASASGTAAPVSEARTAGAMPEYAGARERTLQVSVELLDNITDLVSSVSGALVRNRQYLGSLLADLEDLRRTTTTRQRSGDRLPTPRLSAEQTKLRETLRQFREHHFRLDLAFQELTDKVRASRLQPLRSIFLSYPPFARAAARQEGKQIDVRLEGVDIEVDEGVLAELKEPCLHLLRNAVVHGIETPDVRRAAGKPEVGTIRIAARQDGELVRLELADDGAGVNLPQVRRRALALGLLSKADLERLSDTEAAQLIFKAGLSTATHTSELAGRGMGLDVVAAAIDRMGGTLGLETSQGQGTRFSLLVPVSLSLTRALLVESSQQLFALPNASVVEVFRLPVKEIRIVEGREVADYRGRLLPLVRLREALRLRGIKDIFMNAVGVVVLRVGSELAGFVVDDFFGEREIVARPFGAFVGRPAMASGVTLMENGDVVLILHVPDLLRAVHSEAARRQASAAAGQASDAERRILYVEDSIITREYAANVLRAQGYAVVEAADGAEALEILGREHFDMLLTDLQMPRVDGFKLCAAVRRDPQTRSLPIIVMSTLDTVETKRMALDAGADVYLVKSEFAADTLISAVRQVMS